jgi:hypothetical protein
MEYIGCAELILHVSDNDNMITLFCLIIVVGTLYYYLMNMPIFGVALLRIVNHVLVLWQELW